MRADPDAQATVTDYLDFTEYLPADMMRSLTLIGKLDQTYIDASSTVDELTTIWGKLPSLPADQRPVPTKLRSDISENLNRAVSSRAYSHAEACRMHENVTRHYHKAKTILTKLQTMLENYDDQPKSPIQSKSPQMIRAPKITLRLDSNGQKVQRPPRITVPGEVLAPYEIDFNTYTSSSEESSDEDMPATPPRQAATPAPRIKIVKTPKIPKQRIPKQPRPPRASLSAPSGTATAPISTSTALAQLKPPPENAVPGSSDAPWLQLTPYELAKLRKRMKKNAVWNPSDTMIARELKALGRGVEAFRAAQKKAEDEGKPFEPNLPAPVVDAESGAQHPPEGAISAEALTADEVQLSNRGMKLNEAKKLKREALAKMAADEAEDLNPKLLRVKGKRHLTKPQLKRTKTETPVPLPQITQRPTSVPPPTETPVPVPQLGQQPQVPITSKTPVPVPYPISSESSSMAAVKPATSPAGGASPVPPPTVTTTVPTKPPAETPVPPPVKTSMTPILPPTRELPKRETRQNLQPAIANPRQSTSRANTPVTTPAPEPQSATIRRPTSRGKAASQEPPPTLAAERPRRASTARNTPAPELRQPSKRTKRPAPGVVTNNPGGTSAVGKRKAAPRKKARGSKKGANQQPEQDVEVEVDDDGNVIDPEEPRYCLCNGVSFGTMIQCDNDVSEKQDVATTAAPAARSGHHHADSDKKKNKLTPPKQNCKYEWFHLECVGLSEIPARTTKCDRTTCSAKLEASIAYLTMATPNGYDPIFPIGTKADDKLRAFVSNFYAVSDDPGRNEDWLSYFEPDAVLVMGDKVAKGTEGK
ncbi:putative phd finger domain-containing protein [Eutypa lata UCREL1]|uniref:Putative phd finger domain-containing protein n=1 Tax=Eutypa lata (strain UCR-EL1) TaxID=1287681 RepID=M7TNS2_EUTLA|nr:putative phd finger domain-containing protein [Eutypa lata UCREL1]